jgi:hypothetical protein
VGSNENEWKTFVQDRPKTSRAYMYPGALVFSYIEPTASCLDHRNDHQSAIFFSAERNPQLRRDGKEKLGMARYGKKTSFPKDDLIRTSQDGLAPCIIISRQCQSTISEPPPAMRLLISRCGTASRDDPSFVFMMRELVPARSGMQAGLFFFASIPVLAKRVRCC